jgi:hypothetical protein
MADGEDEEYRAMRARHVSMIYAADDSRQYAGDPAGFGAIALFTGVPTDRALAGWVPYLWATQPDPRHRAAP